MTEYLYLWEFRVHPGREAEFRDHYGPQGSWDSLFRRAPGYIGTQLLKDQTDPLRYVTIDRWESIEAYRAFRALFSQEYSQLDRDCEGLTTSQYMIGEFGASPGTGTDGG